MYKIIFFAFVPDCVEESHNFNMLDERFDTKDDAVKFIKEVEAPRIFSERVAENDPDDFSFELRDYDEEIDLVLYSYDEIESITEYKIKEV